KTFQDPNEDLPFFREELSNSNLGLMINLDWFQPFDNSQYSPSNILTLALIPKPNEPKLHQLNHYLAPLIDQLVDLWNAARKLYRHISARVFVERNIEEVRQDAIAWKSCNTEDAR
ncbi:801_t:CDS:2, partial [Scutellospora calospora]